MTLLLKRSATDEQSFKDYIDSLHEPASSKFHRWMSADDFGATFGASAEDRAAITKWLAS
jgi:hypothetical protein